MKTINSIIENSTSGTLNNMYRYAILFLFSSIIVSARSLLILVLNNLEYVIAQFSF